MNLFTGTDIRNTTNSDTKCRESGTRHSGVRYLGSAAVYQGGQGLEKYNGKADEVVL